MQLIVANLTSIWDPEGLVYDRLAKFSDLLVDFGNFKDAKTCVPVVLEEVFSGYNGTSIVNSNSRATDQSTNEVSAECSADSDPSGTLANLSDEKHKKQKEAVQVTEPFDK